MFPTKSFGTAALLAFAGLTAPAFADGFPITATLSQDVYELGDTIELTVTAPAGTYVCVGIDTAIGSFTLPGLVTTGLGGTPAMTTLDIGFMPSSGQVVFSVPTDCNLAGITQSPIYIQAGGMSPSAIGEVCLTEVETLVVGNGDCNVCATTAVQDPLVSDLPTTGAFHFPGLGGDFEFESQPELSEFKDGTATMSGMIRATGDHSQRFIFNALLTGRLDQGDVAFPPAGGPVLKLKPEMYVDNGGTVDPRNWHYYTDLQGALVGVGALEGAFVYLQDDDQPVQFGRGANGKNTIYGACADLDAYVEKQPFSGPTLASSDQSEMTIQVGNCTPTLEDICVDPSQVTGHVLYWPELSKHFMPVGDITFEEYADGTARLFGQVAAQEDANMCFYMDVHFSDRVDNGDVGFPPSGSPKWGNVDPNTADESTWHYYQSTEGVLIGCESFEGAIVLLDRMGPAFQVGVGANYHDLDYGGSGWLFLDVVRQSDNGPQLTPSTTGDINLDFKICPEDYVPPANAEPIAHWDFDDQTGTKVRDRVGNVDLYWQGDDFYWVDDAHGTGLKFKKADGDMLKSANTSSGSELRKAIQHSNAFTLQVYYSQKEDSDNDARLFSWSTGTDINNRNLTMMSDFENGKFRGELRVKSTSSTSSIKEELGMDEDEAVVYTMVFSEAEGVVRSYLDGVLIGTAPHSGNLSNWSEHEIRLGNENGGERSFKGRMYDVKLWDAALSDAQVLEAANAVKQ